MGFLFIGPIRGLFGGDTYRLITDMGYEIKQSSNKPYTKQYYDINLGSKTVVKYEDKYNGESEGYEYQKKELYSKSLDDKEYSELKTLLNEVVAMGSNKVDDLQKNGHQYFMLEKVGGKTVESNNRDLMKQIERIVRK